jgi:hypothetical protein
MSADGDVTVFPQSGERAIAMRNAEPERVADHLLRKWQMGTQPGTATDRWREMDL